MRPTAPYHPMFPTFTPPNPDLYFMTFQGQRHPMGKEHDLTKLEMRRFVCCLCQKLHSQTHQEKFYLSCTKLSLSVKKNVSTECRVNLNRALMIHALGTLRCSQESTGAKQETAGRERDSCSLSQLS
ncbi:hypothetical protein AOLI_G00124290 [Acnodon oligacanthus]